MNKCKRISNKTAITVLVNRNVPGLREVAQTIKREDLISAIRDLERVGVGRLNPRNIALYLMDLLPDGRVYVEVECDGQPVTVSGKEILGFYLKRMKAGSREDEEHERMLSEMADAFTKATKTMLN